MTSQVAMLNAQGVALASDSAVTFGDDRVYNSINKIFPLSKPHQIAFMFSENAHCQTNGMRWERVISRFVDDKYSANHQPANQHSDYVDDFIAFMEDRSNSYDKKQNSIAVEHALRKWLRNFAPLRDIQAIIAAVGRGTYLLDETHDVGEGDENPISLPDRMISKVQEESPNHIHKLHENMNKSAVKFHPNQNELTSLLTRLKRFHSKALKNVSNHFIEEWNLPDDGTDWNELIVDICIMLMSCYPDPRQDFRENRTPRDDDYPRSWGPWWFDFTTLAIVGFGSEDNEPGMVELRIGPVIIPDVESNRRNLVGRARPQKEAVYNISKPDSVLYNGFLNETYKPGFPKTSILEAGAFIKPFAMSREIDNILNGIHYNTLETRIKSIPEMIHGLLGGWISERLDERRSNGDLIIGTGTKRNVQKALEGTRDNDSFSDIDLLSLLQGSVMGTVMDSRAYRRHEFRRIAMGIPMKELADFARTLIGIEAQICHWLHPIRSVGGDIDVATITKEEGFEWVHE